MNMFNFTQDFFVGGLSQWGLWASVFALCDLILNTCFSIAFFDVIKLRISLRGYAKKG